MLTMLTAPLTQPAATIADKCRSFDDSVNYWFAVRGHGPNMARLVKLAPVVAVLAVAVGFVA